MTSLKKTFLLSWVLYKSGAVSTLSGQMRARKQKRGGSAFSDSLRKLTSRFGGPWLLYLVLYGFLGVMMFKGGSELTGNLRGLGMPELFHVIYTSGISYYLLLTGFFYVSSTYYLAKDTERLLALPFTGAQIITARYLLIYLYQLYFCRWCSACPHGSASASAEGRAGISICGRCWLCCFCRLYPSPF